MRIFFSSAGHTAPPTQPKGCQHEHRSGKVGYARREEGRWVASYGRNAGGWYARTLAEAVERIAYESEARQLEILEDLEHKEARRIQAERMDRKVAEIRAARGKGRKGNPKWDGYPSGEHFDYSY